MAKHKCARNVCRCPAERSPDAFKMKGERTDIRSVGFGLENSRITSPFSVLVEKTAVDDIALCFRVQVCCLCIIFFVRCPSATDRKTCSRHDVIRPESLDGGDSLLKNNHFKKHKNT